MMREEYEELAGRKVSQIEYSIIDRIYSADPRSKEVFVKAVIGDIDGIQTRIMRLVDEEVEKRCAGARKPYAEKIMEYENESVRLKSENRGLRKELDMALEYMPYEISNMDDIRYHNLADGETSVTFSEKQAKDYIASEFGFDFDKIEVLFEIDVCRIDRFKRISTIGIRERKPMYESSDWNYVRFNVVDMKYECVDGELYIL